MKANLLQFLSCPDCQSDLRCIPFQKERKEIISGIISCSNCGSWYPIIRSIPRILTPSLKEDLILKSNIDFLENNKHLLPKRIEREWSKYRKQPLKKKKDLLKKKTAKSFAFEWTKFNKMFEAYRMNFLNYIDPINEKIFNNKVVLDAGCGVGRHTYWATKFGAKEIIGIDLSNAVEASYENTKEFPNVHIIQADIYNLPFKKIFDYIFCIGVLHHLPEPEKGFQSLLKYLKTNGTISIWVYGKRNNFSNVYFYESLRKITRLLPHRLVYNLSYLPALGVEICNLLYKKFRKNSLTKSLAELLPFKYYSNFPFEVKLNDAFDVFATPKSTYWLKEEIEDWFRNAGIKNFSITYLRKKGLKGYGKI